MVWIAKIYTLMGLPSLKIYLLCVNPTYHDTMCSDNTYLNYTKYAKSTLNINISFVRTSCSSVFEYQTNIYFNAVRFALILGHSSLFKFVFLLSTLQLIFGIPLCTSVENYILN